MHLVPTKIVRNFQVNKCCHEKTRIFALLHSTIRLILKQIGSSSIFIPLPRHSFCLVASFLPGKEALQCVILISSMVCHKDYQFY